MAKNGTAEAVPSPAPAQSPPSYAKPIETKGEPEVIRWGNGGPIGQEPEVDPDAAAAEQEQKAKGGRPKREKPEVVAKPEAETEETEQEAPGDSQDEPGEEDETEEGEDTPAERPSAKGAARRRQLMETIERDKARRAIEDQVQAERKKAADLENEIKALKGRSLKSVLASTGKTREELLDMLLIKSDDVDYEPEKGTPAPKAEESQTVAELKAEVARLAKMLEPTVAERENAQWATAEKNARDMLKGVSVPLVTTMRGGVRRAIQLAHDMWQASGKSGRMRDYLEDAASEVDDQLAKEEPEVAAVIRKRAKRAAETEEDEDEEPEEEAPKPAAIRPGVGRRTGRRVRVREEQLPSDPVERDRLIKKSYGW